MPLGRKSRYRAPAIVYFRTADHADRGPSPAVYAQCAYTGIKAGPLWGQDQLAVKRVLDKLTRQCKCGRRQHYARGFEGKRTAIKG